ncbi:MAG: selenium cofactor biosynthesis protein YqeC [Anaerolineales bacterium]
MKLIEALRYSLPSSLAFVGAGGKTTALFRSGRELLTEIQDDELNKTVLVTTTTHIGAWQLGKADHHFIINSASEFVKLEEELPAGVVLLTGEEKYNLLGGLSPGLLDKVRAFAEDHKLHLLIEADGSHACPLKAPAEHEPAIPDFTQNVIVVAGLMGLGKPLTKKWVHRPEKFAELSGLQIGEAVTSDALVKVLINWYGGLKNIPSDARRSILLNQADTAECQSKAKTISEQLISNYHSIIIASLAGDNTEIPSQANQIRDLQKGIHAVIEPIGGVILAAGGSSRLGEPKQLLLWKGQPLIRHVAIAALKAGLTPVVVVVGSSAEEVQSSINDLPLRIVINSEWDTGLSSSIKRGIAPLPKEIGGAVFLQADQPQIPPLLIKSLVEAHQTTLSPIVAPQIDGQRGNPVLFDSSTFSKLLSLEGDLGGRDLFGRLPVHWVTWHDPNLLLDIDTPKDYQKFLGLYTEGEGKA